MTSNKEDMLYVDYNDYNYVTREFKEAIEYNYDEDSLEKVISYMRSLKHNMKKEDDIIKKFFRLLRNDDIYIKGTTPKYCKYINLWLNKEYLKEHNQNKVKNFDVFKKFVNQLNYVKFGNQDNSCEKYINPLETKTIIKIEFLYDLYDKYNKIKSLSPEIKFERRLKNKQPNWPRKQQQDRSRKQQQDGSRKQQQDGSRKQQQDGSRKQQIDGSMKQKQDGSRNQLLKSCRKNNITNNIVYYSLKFHY
ncbi:hypothetical protein PVNG_05434 [Plasmodium vivax North Korean]|uniref:Uncharacterized protein n=1 Tax=Plasmodium vivax North Korean TaxID=1035514 RepID=A0A0J9TM63_PLAVI|nr:hypothetical protein PVNG_05434 [Plasmodium vivax North Korean]